MLQAGGFSLDQSIDYQRYGLENHLQWLSAGEPGGSLALRKIFAGSEAGYVRDLERAGHVDSFIAVVQASTEGGWCTA